MDHMRISGTEPSSLILSEQGSFTNLHLLGSCYIIKCLPEKKYPDISFYLILKP